MLHETKLLRSGSDFIIEPETQTPDAAYFLKLSESRMPFGKYKDRRLIDLPESYLIWLARKGYPKGMLGVMLKDVYEIKLNGLEGLLRHDRHS